MSHKNPAAVLQHLEYWVTQTGTLVVYDGVCMINTAQIEERPVLGRRNNIVYK